MTRLRVYFRAPAFVIRNSNISGARSTKATAIPAKRNGARELSERERERFTDIYRARTQKLGIYFRVQRGTRSSIKYTPPSLDKLKRRMTVLRRRSLVMPSVARPSTAREREKDDPRTYDSYQIARAHSILRHPLYPVTIMRRMTLTARSGHETHSSVISSWRQ